MNYPFWDIPVGYGLLMGVIAVVHVFISHFAIGGGLYLVVTEHRARRRNDEAALAFLQRLTRFFVLVSLVAGALTGVGIWFIIGLISPVATEALIHHYVWGWAIEWTFFVVEIAAALVYYYGWTRLPARSHLVVGWIYFISAWLSLFVINGIITFMLTPGQWLVTGAFWDGFFNPTFWVSLVLRTGVCIMLAGLYALLVAARTETGDFKARIVRYSAAWGLVGLLVAAASQLWYWRAIPVDVTRTALATMPMPVQAHQASFWLALALALLLILTVLVARRLPLVLALVLMVLGLAWFGAFESFRESIRKPYVVTGYIYGNGVELARLDHYRETGLLAAMTYRTGNDGADLFRHACRSCHTVNGYKPLAPAFDGTDPDFIAAIARATELLRGNMPPFAGTDEEADELAAHLYAQVDQRSLADICAERGVDLGATAFAVRCATCHVPGTESDNASSFAGLEAQDIDDMLEMADSLGDGMPAYTGDATERAALVAYLQAKGQEAN